MSQRSTDKAKGKKNRPKTKLGIPDLEHSKAAVLRSLGSPDSRRGYQHAIDEFVAWYCSEPRLVLNKTVVLRYRFHLEERGLAPGTINVRMAPVRRLAYEAADSGLLSPELAAGIHRVKGVRKLGSRLGNWLTAGEASALWQLPDGQTLTGKRNRAILAILLGCGLRRRELAELTLGEPTASRGALGHRGSYRQGKAHTNRSCTKLGETDARCVVIGSQYR
jgi:site-specific recombinase XerD